MRWAGDKPKMPLPPIPSGQPFGVPDLYHYMVKPRRVAILTRRPGGALAFDANDLQRGTRQANGADAARCLCQSASSVCNQTQGAESRFCEPRRRLASSRTTMPTSRPASTSCSGRLRPRSARSRKIRAWSVRSSSARCLRTSPSPMASTQTEQYVDMLNAGIVDPAKVVRVALQDAASIAGLMITTEAMVDAEEEGGSGDARRRNGRYGLLINQCRTQGGSQWGSALHRRRGGRPLCAHSGHSPTG